MQQGAVHLIALPFVAAYRLTYGVARFFGHGVRLMGFMGRLWLACIERGEMVEFFVGSMALVVVNRSLNVLANPIRPKAKMRWTVERPTVEAAFVAAARRRLSPELRALVG